jgi:acetyltransferase-like isoleucine patch superfamily enzyme
MPVATVGSVACLRCATGCGVDSPTGPMIPSCVLTTWQLSRRSRNSTPAIRRLDRNCCSDWWARVAPVPVTVTPPLRLDYGQYIHIGADTFLNYDCVLLDVCEIRIGSRCQLGPRVQILTATHPLDAAQRAEGWESGAPVRIGDDVWIGGGAIILPGLVIGDGSVVGAGSVVTHDVPARTVVAGNPARVIRHS